MLKPWNCQERIREAWLFAVHLAPLRGRGGHPSRLTLPPDLTYGELQDPLSFGGSLGLNGNKVIFNAATYRGNLGGLLSPELHAFRVACGPSRGRLTRQQPPLQ